MQFTDSALARNISNASIGEHQLELEILVYEALRADQASSAAGLINYPPRTFQGFYLNKSTDKMEMLTPR